MRVQFANRILEAPPLEKEELSQWTNRIFGQKKFGIIINDGEVFNTEMNKTLVSIVEPLFNIIGVPLNGICTTYFVGNYGFTPLGIHQDVKGEDVFHFHLGPGAKTMYTWDEHEYKKLSGVDNNQQIEPLLPYADAYTFHTGDVFYMPWFKYHIGYSAELSLGLTIWLNNLTPQKLVINIVEEMIEGMLPKNTKNQNPILLPLDKGIAQTKPLQYKKLSNYLNFSQECQSKSFEEYFASLFEDYRLKLFSNGASNYFSH